MEPLAAAIQSVDRDGLAEPNTTRARDDTSLSAGHHPVSAKTATAIGFGRRGGIEGLECPF
jgi:hypothetical protein